MKKQIKIACTKSEFFINYLLVTKPYHNLTDNEIQLAAKLMYYYAQYSKSIDKDDLVFELLFSTKSRKNIREELNIDKAVNFNVTFNALKKKGIIQEQDEILSLNQSYRVKLKENQASVEYIFKIKDNETK